ARSAGAWAAASGGASRNHASLRLQSSCPNGQFTMRAVSANPCVRQTWEVTSMPRVIVSMGRFAVALSLVLASTAALAQSVSTNYMPGTDFSKYHTYKWVPVQGAAQVDQILDQQIKQAVDTQLASKSFTKKDGDPVDMYVGYQVAVNEEKELNALGG